MSTSWRHRVSTTFAYHDIAVSHIAKRISWQLTGPLVIDDLLFPAVQDRNLAVGIGSGVVVTIAAIALGAILGAKRRG